MSENNNTIQPAKRGAGSKSLWTTLIIIIVLIAAVFLFYTVVRKEAYNDAMDANQILSPLNKGGASVFVVRKMGLSFCFQLKDGKLVNSSRAAVPSDGSPQPISSGGINVLFYNVYTDEEIQAFAQRKAFNYAESAVSHYYSENATGNNNGKVIPDGNMFVIGISEGTYYFKCEDNHLLEEPFSEEDLPKKYKKLTPDYFQGLGVNVTIYIAKKSK